MPDRQMIDLTGLKCPLPIVELNKLVNSLAEGDEFVAVADDPAFCLDARAWCEMTRNELVELRDSNEHFVAVIRVRE